MPTPHDEAATTHERDLSLSESLGNRIRTVSRAFYREHDRLSEGLEYWIHDVYLDALIALETQDREATALYQVPYQWNDGDPTFAEKSAWSEVDVQYVELDGEAMQERKRSLVDADVSERYQTLPPLVIGEDGEVTQESAEEVAQAIKHHAEAVSGQRGADAPAIHVGTREAPQLGTKQYRAYSGPATQVRRSRDGNRLVVTINTAEEDRHGTIILPRGARLDTYNETNPIVLINHDYRLPAATSSVGVVGSGLSARLQANVPEDSWDLDDPEIARWHRKITRPRSEGGPIVQAASIGAIFHEVVPGREFAEIEELLGRKPEPDEQLPFVVTDWELVEWSFVSVPSNPGALVSSGLEMGAIQRFQQRLLDRIGRIEQRLQGTRRESISAPTGSSETNEETEEREGSPSQEAADAPPTSTAPEATSDSEESAAADEADEARAEATRPPANESPAEERSGPPEKLSITETRALARELVPLIDRAVEDAINRRTGRA